MVVAGVVAVAPALAGVANKTLGDTFGVLPSGSCPPKTVVSGVRLRTLGLKSPHLMADGGLS